MILFLSLILSNALAAPVSVKFIIIGDSGTGDKNQYAVASAINEVCKLKGCQFALDAGDNIYEYGVNGSKDKQFQEKFEIPYKQLNFPFYMALGNHDQSGIIPGSGVHPEKGNFEIEYTKHSKKWKLPKRYYNFSMPSNSTQPIIDFFTIDTNPLAPQNKPQRDWYKPFQKFDIEQRRWLHNSISNSNATWKIVLGHHPYRNNGKHDNAGEFEGIGLATGEELKKMYEEEVCGQVDFLITGHDHSLQWLEPYKKCGTRPQFIISGASAKTNGPKSPNVSDRSNKALWEAYNTLGFFWAEATKDKIKIMAYAVKNKKITKEFEYVINK